MRTLGSPKERAMKGSACARMFDGNCDGSLPSRRFAPTRGSRATGAVRAATAADDRASRGRTRLSSRLSNMSAPDDNRSSRRFRAAAGSFSRLTAGIAGPWLRGKGNQGGEVTDARDQEKFTAVINCASRESRRGKPGFDVRRLLGAISIGKNAPSPCSNLAAEFFLQFC